MINLFMPRQLILLEEKFIFNRIFMFSLFFLGLNACKKTGSFIEKNPNTSVTFMTTNSSCNYEQALREIATLISNKAGNDPAFKAQIYSLCYQQLYGDYNVRIIDILEPALEAGYIGEGDDQYLRERIEIYHCGTGSYPILFIPHLEEVEKTYFENQQYVLGYPNVSFDFEYDDASQTTPSYKYDESSNSLEPYLESMNEEMAWNFEYDAWVFGGEENVSTENQVAASNDTANVITNTPPIVEEVQLNRINGKMEWGGWIQVTNCGAIEPWVKGKFEFKYFVNKSDGGILKDRAFGKWRRKNFHNQHWFTFTDLIGYWNLSNWGPMQLERWIEEDGGSGTTTVTQSFNPGSGLPTVNVSHTFKSGDDDLGASNVQFTDYSLPSLNYTVYNISYMNFTRKSEQ